MGALFGMNEKATMVRFVADRESGFECVLSRGRSVHYPAHTHASTVTVLLVRDGRVALRLDGGRRILRKGDGAVVAPHRLHGIDAAGPHELISVCLDRRHFSAWPSRSARTGVATVLAAERGHGCLRAGEREVVMKLLSEWGGPGSEPDDAIAGLKNRLAAFPETAVSLADMAAAAHVGERHLIRLFARRYGLSPRRFQNQCRLRKLGRGLARGASLTHAALAAGFYDQSHCIRHFRRLYAMTPGQYLRACEPTGPV